ncbi:DUF4150 domain-containing protein [Aliikangiella sp. IMCC44359]|uniref:DUF4150 domain-containing protein n=1 Tax=Aliikangiella sp. IMCC44359 TaxID=3459125 RepID=UPI00403B2ED6
MARTVFANNRNFSHKGSGDKSVCSAPDVCKTPVGSATPPIPYPVISQAADADGYTTSVFIDGNPTSIASSTHSKCSGDQAGSAKGLISGTTGDKTEFITYSFDVKCEGEGVVRHMDMTKMNNGNTLGMVYGTATPPGKIDEEQEDKDLFEQGLKKLIVRIEMSVEKGRECKDTFILRAADGSYESTKIVKSDLVKGDKYIDLVYEEVDGMKKYSLEHKVEETGESFFYFEDESYGRLAALSKSSRNNKES